MLSLFQKDQVWSSILKLDLLVVQTKLKLWNIDFLVKVKFQLRYDYTNCIHEVKISIKKENTDNDTNVKIYITCKSLNYYKQFVCSETWAEYVMDMGNIKCFIDIIKNVETLTSKLEIGIIVHKIKKNELRMPNMYEDTDFTDFHLSATDGRVALHKACLVAHSDVFKAMLATKWKETEDGSIDLKNVTVKTLQHLKAYMYCGTVPDENEIDELCPLLLLASQYLIQDLKDQCIINLARTVKPEKLQCLVDFAIDTKMSDLVAIAQLTPDDVVHAAYQIKDAKHVPIEE